MSRRSSRGQPLTAPLLHLVKNKLGVENNIDDGFPELAVPKLSPLIFKQLSLSESTTAAVINQYVKDALDRKSNNKSKEELESDAPNLLNEMLRYLKMKILKHGNFPAAAEVDCMWHSFILCSKAYRSFCNEENRGIYLDHEPGTFHLSSQNGISAYEAGLAKYEEVFGEVPPEKYWSVPRKRQREERKEEENKEDDDGEDAEKEADSLLVTGDGPDGKDEDKKEEDDIEKEADQFLDEDKRDDEDDEKEADKVLVTKAECKKNDDKTEQDDGVNFLDTGEVPHGEVLQREDCKENGDKKVDDDDDGANDEDDEKEAENLLITGKVPDGKELFDEVDK